MALNSEWRDKIKSGLGWIGLFLVGFAIAGAVIYGFRLHKGSNDASVVAASAPVPSSGKTDWELPENKVLLDAFLAQAEKYSKDERFDSRQQLTIQLMIPAAINDAREKGLSRDEMLQTVAMFYAAISDPNGFRAEPKDGNDAKP